MKVKKYFGLKTSTYCDRCHIDISKGSYTLCNECFYIDPVKLRWHELELPYQAKMEGLTCSLCKRKRSDSNLNQVCYNCISQHYDNSHSGAWRINWSPETDSVVYRHCYGCGGVVKITSGKNIKFEYYALGTKTPTQTSYKCDKGLKTNVEECVHDWFVLDSNVKSDDEAHRAYAEFISNPAATLLGMSRSEVEHITFGSTKYWCIKCGAFYDLSPQKEHKLPDKGWIK